MRYLLLAASLAAVPAVAAVPAPDRAVTDPKSITSPADPAARPVPLDDLSITRNVSEQAWSADGSSVYLSANITGRYNIWKTSAAGSWPVQLTASDDSQRQLAPSPDGAWLVYAQDAGGNELYDLIAVSAAGGAPVRLTETPAVREQRPHFSPDGKSLAFDIKPNAAPSMDIAVMDVASRKVRVLTKETDPQFQWGLVDWAPDGKSLIANRENTDQTRASVWRINVATGALTELTPSRKPRELIASDLSADGKTLAIISDEVSGQRQAGLFDIATGKTRWLKTTPWAQRTGAFSPDGAQLLVQNSVDGRTEVTLVDVATLAERPLTFPAGVNNAVASLSTPFSPDGKRLLINHASGDTPGDVFVADAATGAAAPLTRLSMASLDPAHLPKSQIVTYKSFDGTLVSAILTLPANLKRDGSNPAILVPHGGPAGQAEDAFNRTATALASRGYVVLTPNFRGSTGYGRAFQMANIKDLGGGDLKDMLAAKDFLVATGYVDPKKVGMTGGSYGGFMTLMALGKAPDTFAAAVQMYGIIDWVVMEKTSEAALQQYIHSLLGDPVKDKAAYLASSPMTYIQAVKTPLLSLQGENDVRVPRDQTRQVNDILKAKGNVVETVYYPAEGHGFQKRENQSDVLRRTIAWFDHYLKGEGPAPK
jgi:dipeptidyl aminopeptidase/acylaminoacyl peptidase